MNINNGYEQLRGEQITKKNLLNRHLPYSIQPHKQDLQLFIKQIKLLLTNNGYIIRHINVQHNSINGLLTKQKNKYFFKVLSQNEYKREIRGYYRICKHYPVPPLVEINISSNFFIIIYEYEKTIKKNSGLLCDFICKNEILKKSDVSDISSIFRIYKIWY